jgi:hypothetical protein
MDMFAEGAEFSGDEAPRVLFVQSTWVWGGAFAPADYGAIGVGRLKKHRGPRVYRTGEVGAAENGGGDANEVDQTAARWTTKVSRRPGACGRMWAISLHTERAAAFEPKVRAGFVQNPWLFAPQCPTARGWAGWNGSKRWAQQRVSLF